jgi:hypothetical protein
MTPLVAYKKSDRPQNRVVLANGMLQSGDKSCQGRKFMGFGQASGWFQISAIVFSLGRFHTVRVIYMHSGVPACGGY